MENARVQAGGGRAAWSGSFHEIFALLAGVFSNAEACWHGGLAYWVAVSHGAEELVVAGGGRLGYASPDGSG
jgi:hypothetical protein